jgi:hypothetical protein
MGDVMRVISPTQRKSLDFLKKELADGAKPVIELQHKARAEGIPTRSLTASRKLLGVKVTREGGQTGNFFWSLPE